MKNILILAGLGLATIGTTYFTTTKCELLEEDAKRICMEYMRQPYFMKKAHFNPDKLKDLHAEDVPVLQTRTSDDYITNTMDELTFQEHSGNLFEMYQCLYETSPAFKKVWDKPIAFNAKSHSLGLALFMLLDSEPSEAPQPTTAEKWAIIKKLSKDRMHLSFMYSDHLISELTKTGRTATAEELAVIRKIQEIGPKNEFVYPEQFEAIKKRAGLIARLKSKML
jgi:hypothetical protein